MPNTIYYSDEEAAEKSLNVGNFYIGTGDVSKAPTNTTSFFNGINPPNGGYTIYLNKSGGNGPSISRPSNDANLIAQTNEIADASYTTVNQCFTFFAGQSDKMVMFNPINTIITDSLVACFSAGTLPSYPRSGTTWYDLGSESNNATLENSPTFDSDGWFDLDGTDDEISLGTNGSSLIQGKENISLCILYKMDSLASLRGLLGSLNYGCTQNLGLVASFGTLQFYNDTTNCNSVNISNQVVTGKWLYAAGTYDGSTTRIYGFKDGTLAQNSGTTKTGNTNTFTSDFQILGAQHSGFFTNGQVAQALVYQKTLSETEILQNYHQGAIVTDDLKFAIDPGNLVSYYNNVPSNTTTNSLVGTITGTLTNGVGFNTNSGGYWDFDGVDDMIDTPSLTGTDLEFLSNPSDTGGLTYSIWSKNDSSSSYYLLSTGSQTSSTGVALSYQAGSGFVSLDTGTKNMSFGISSYWPLNEWVHFTFVQDELTWYFYKNGIQIGTGGINGTSTASDLQTKLRIAGPNNSTCCRFDGQVGSVLVYDRALTAAEVGQNYGATINKFN